MTSVDRSAGGVDNSQYTAVQLRAIAKGIDKKNHYTSLGQVRDQCCAIVLNLMAYPPEK